MQYVFGFIGVGSMGGALARAACRKLHPSQVIVSNRTAAKAEALAAELGCAVGDCETVARTAKYVFLGVKPQRMAELLESIAPALAGRTEPVVLVSMAAGLTLEKLRTMADYPIIRIMPNTPAAVGEGVILYAASERVSPRELDAFVDLMGGGGLLDPLEERLLDAGTAVAGCGGAFADLFIEALADGGVACGLPRDKALRYAAQMLAGTARLMLETGKHPAALKDEVCSPGGSTIQGVRALERGGFRSAVFEAVLAACEKSRQLGE